LTRADQYFKPGTTFQALDAVAEKMSDTDYAMMMQKPYFRYLIHFIRPFPDFDFSFIKPVRQKAVQLLQLKPWTVFSMWGADPGEASPTWCRRSGHRAKDRETTLPLPFIQEAFYFFGVAVDSESVAVSTKSTVNAGSNGLSAYLMLFAEQASWLRRTSLDWYWMGQLAVELGGRHRLGRNLQSGIVQLEIFMAMARPM